MNDFHGIIFAYSASPDLRELVNKRTAASLPICGRYRVIDFALSSLRNAGIINVGVIMQRDYQSLLDHIGTGKPWDMSRREGGLRMLPPFGLPEYHKGNYSGTMEALNAVSSYVHDIKEKNVVLMLGNACMNLDLSKACEAHEKGGADITAICTHAELAGRHHRYITDENGYVSQVLFEREGAAEGVTTLEAYIIKKETLLSMMDRCRSQEQYRFHRDGISAYLRDGGKMKVFFHDEYVNIIRTVDDYYKTNMDILEKSVRNELFPEERPVQTKHPEGVSTYYGEKAMSKNSMVADNCLIEGSIENCILFPGVVVKQNASLKNCIIMKDTVIEEGVILEYVISDKDVTFSPNITLMGNQNLPIVVPKSAKI